MELSSYLELAIKEFGGDIMSSSKLIYILSDYNAFKSNIAAKLILKTAISSNYLTKFLSIGKYDTHAQLLISSFAYNFGFNQDNVKYVFLSVAEALNWELQKDNGLRQFETSKIYVNATEETLNLLKAGCIFCKKDKQTILLSLDGKKSIATTLPFDYSYITKEGIIINQSTVFGYEPYDLFYGSVYEEPRIKDKYFKMLDIDNNDWSAYYNKYGFNNRGMLSFDGSTLIPFEYSDLYQIKEGVFYAVIKSDEGDYARVINSNGKVLLDNVEKCNYYDYIEGNNINNGIIKQESNGAITFFNTFGEKVFQQFDYVYFTISGKYAKVRKNGKCGVVDKKGNIIISPIFDFCSVYENQNLIEARLSGKYGLFDIQGICLLNFEYDDIRVYTSYSIIIVKKGNLFGAVDMCCKEIIPCGFESLEIEIGGCCLIEKDPISEKYGVFDKTYTSGPTERGVEVIPCIFDSYDIYSAIIAKKNGMYGMYGFNGRKIVDCKYKEISACINGSASFKDEKEQGIISCHDRELFRTSKYEYRFIQPYANNNRYIALNSNDKWGLLDARGNEATEFTYDRLVHISFGLTIAYKKLNSPCYSNSYICGLINSYGDVILPIEYHRIDCISEKLFKVTTNSYKYFCCNENGEKIIDDFRELKVINNLLFIKSRIYDTSNTKDHYNIFNKTGKFVNTAIYDEIDFEGGFILGLIKVTRNGKVGFINELGIEVIPCIYEDARIPVKIN